MIGYLLQILSLLVALQWATCHEFLHVPSAIKIPKPPGGPSLHIPSEFGFSMGYWNKSLIISSPKSETPTDHNFGEIYSCPVTTNIADGNLNCGVLELNITSSKYSLDPNPAQHFYLGGSIATTKNFLFICAPLVTKLLKNRKAAETVGSCFVYSNGISTPYLGPGERFEAQDPAYSEVALYNGGTGWTTLADEENDMLIIAKTSVSGDMNYLPMSNLIKTKPSSLTVDIKDKDIFRDTWDIGYGIAAGKFFSLIETVYAFSTQTNTMTGTILFMRFRHETKKAGRRIINTKHKKSELIKNPQHDDDYTMASSYYSLHNKAMGAMFGYALAASDLTQDGYSELLVGAPLLSESANIEHGALHIYLGGEMSMSERRRERVIIYGFKQQGRFGTTIAVSDIDGDGIPEVFVSAPYEDSGTVYILSGLELKKLLQEEIQQKKLVSELMHTQKVTREDLKLESDAQVGFSLQVVPDIDENGCNELAIGAPGTDSVVLLRCLQTIGAEITTRTVEPKVWVQDDKFTVKVCLSMTYMSSKDIVGIIIVTNNIDIAEGHSATIRGGGRLAFDISTKKDKYCDTIIVDLERGETGRYLLTTKAQLNDNAIRSTSTKDYNKSWALLSEYYSKLQCNLDISRVCNIDDDCTPKLSLAVKWKTAPHKDSEPKQVKKNNVRSYEVESTKTETVSIIVKNIGDMTIWNKVCVGVEVEGATVSSANCITRSTGRMDCMLRTPIRLSYEGVFDIVLDMTRITNSHKELTLIARLYENCANKTDSNKMDDISLVYDFQSAWKRINLEGKTHDISITDKQLTPEELQKKSIFRGDQEYWITNDGNVTWEHITAVIVIENRPFVTKVGILENSNCTVLDEKKQHTVKCILKLLPSSTNKIIVWVELAGKEIGDNLNGGRKINVTSQMKLYMSEDMSSDAETITKLLVSDIKLKKDISFANKPWLIALVAVIIALILLALVVYCLYKKGFFKRDKKKKLDVLRESVRRRSIRLASVKSRPSQAAPSTADGDDHIDIEVVEDSPFEEVPISSKDDVVLIEAQVEVHGHTSEEKKCD